MTFLKRDTFCKIFALLVSGMFPQKSIEPKGDSKMKRFFVFALIALFAATCLLVVNLNADNPTDTDSGTVLDNVFVEAYAATYWSSPYASSHMDGAIINNGGDRVKYYFEFLTNMDGPLWNDEDKVKAGGADDWVEIGARWSNNYNVSFNLSNERDGDWTIWASSEVTVKADLDDNGILNDMDETEVMTAYAWTDFEI